MSRRWAAGLAVAALFATASCSSGSDEPAKSDSATKADDSGAVRPAGLGITAPSGSLDSAMTIGVIVSLSSAPGEGMTWAQAASGAQVAAYRYELAGQTVDLQVVDDQGTAEGFEAALSQLSDAKVSGIVAATSGTHVTDALEATTPTVPVLLPYETESAGLPDDVWLTGPSDEQEGTATADLLQRIGSTRPFVVTSPDEPLSAFSASDGMALGADTTAATVLKAIGQASKGDNPPDSVVLAAPSELAANVVKTLQGTQLDLPLVIGREAVSPGFAPALQAAGATTSYDFTTVGADTSDTVVNVAGTEGDRASSFFTALELAASDPSVTGLLGDGTFADTAGSADIASHDAVVALVSAAREAGSTDAADVTTALSGLTVSGKQGLAGPDLDFSDQTAMPDDAVVALQSTDQPSGVRPATAGAAPTLSWFALPDVS